MRCFVTNYNPPFQNPIDIRVVSQRLTVRPSGSWIRV